MRSILDAVTERGSAAKLGGGEVNRGALGVEEPFMFAFAKTWSAPLGRLRLDGEEVSSLDDDGEAFRSVCIDVELDNGSGSEW